MYNVYDVVASGLSAMRLRINTIASNIANAQTTRTEDGGPYKKKDIILNAKDTPSAFGNMLDEMSLARPSVLAVVEDQSEPRKVLQPGHPDADADGYVAYPNINVVESMTNLMNASRLYEANISTLKAAREMSKNATRISAAFLSFKVNQVYKKAIWILKQLERRFLSLSKSAKSSRPKK